MEREAWQAILHRVEKSQIQLKRLSMHACIILFWRNYLELIISILETENKITLSFSYIHLLLPSRNKDQSKGHILLTHK